MITRKIGKIIAGDTTPAQIMLACVLGAALGFMPGFVQAAGLIALAALLLVLLNANLWLAGVIGLVAKALSLLLMPVSYYLGRALLDGPTRPVFEWLINTPVLALFGFEYYATTGGLVIGVALGLLSGLLIVTGVRRLRAKLAGLQEGSERFQQWTSKGWVKLATWLLVGSSPKGGYRELLTKRGKVIRPLGLALAGLLIVLGVLVQLLLTEPIVTAAVQRGLARANGATVNLESADLSLREGRMTLRGLQMADPNKLTHDLLRAKAVEIDISAADLLRKRMTLDRVELTDAWHGPKRDTPGRIVGRKPQPTEPEPEADEKTIEDYLKDAQRWKERLAQARRWLEKISGPADPDAPPEQRRESVQQRLKHRIRAHGYANVKAAHLIEDAPTLLVRELATGQVRTTALPAETLDIHGQYLSTHPHLTKEAPQLTVTSSKGTIDGAVNLAGASAAGGQSTVRLVYKGLSADTIGEQLALGMDQPPISGGTVDIGADGTLQTAGVPSMDLPMKVQLNNSTVRVPGVGSTAIEKMNLQMGLTGPIDSPRIRIEPGAVARALAQAGASALANKLKSEAGKAIDEATKKASDKAKESAGEKLKESAGDALKGIFGGGKKNGTSTE